MVLASQLTGTAIRWSHFICYFIVAHKAKNPAEAGFLIELDG